MSKCERGCSENYIKIFKQGGIAMARYIDAENLIEELSAACMPIHEKGITGILGDDSSIVDIINQIPTVEVQEVKHGEWQEQGKIYICSQCGYIFDTEGYLAFFNYCPCCGARMEGDKE